MYEILRKFLSKFTGWSFKVLLTHFNKSEKEICINFSITLLSKGKFYNSAFTKVFFASPHFVTNTYQFITSDLTKFIYLSTSTILFSLWLTI